MTILVTGANGQLGREMRIVSQDSANRYIFADIVPVPEHDTLLLDITDQDAVYSVVDQYDVKAIVNCAAYTNVDKAEEDQELCLRLNAEAPANLARAMKKVGGVLIHISTDYVFGGRGHDAPLSEDTACAPESVYGRTKLLGEKAIQESGCDALIIRTAWLYSEFGKNFVKTMLALTSSKPQIKVVSDQRGTPTYALDLANFIFDVVENAKYQGNSGVYHYTDEGECTWYEFARTIAEYAGHSSCEILPCTSQEYPSPVRRPEYSVLDKSKVKAVFGADVPYWTDSLKKCLKNLSE